jgi:AbrB family looped-hinge helix DNA binding protein
LRNQPDGTVTYYVDMFSSDETLCAEPSRAFTATVKEVSRISAKNQVTIPVAVLEEAGLHAGDPVVVEALEEGELRIRRGELRFERAFGALTGSYPPCYLERLDREDAER